MSQTENNRVPFWVKFGYGGGEGSNSLIWTLFYIFFLFYLTDVVKIKPATAGLIIMIGVVWDAISDPLIGIWSDNLKWKWGRRRPLLLLVAVPFGILAWLLFTDFGLSGTGTVIYFTFAVIAYMTAFTILSVPYTAMAAEMTQDYDERTSLISYRTVWSMVASVIGAGLPLSLVSLFTETFGSQKIGWSLTAAIFGLASIFPILLTWRVTRGYELFPDQLTVKWRDIKEAFFGNRPFRFVMGIWACGIIAINISSAAAVYFFSYRMGFSEDESSVAFIIFMCASIFWIPIINKTTHRLGKRTAFVIFMGIWAVVSAFPMLMVDRGDIVFLYILLFFAAMGNSGIYLLGWSMIPDVIEVDEFKTGQRREGLYFGIISFVQKLGSAIAIWLIGIILSWIGYTPGAVQSNTAIWGIRLIFAEGTAFFAILAVVICLLSPMNRERHQALIKAIAEKKTNQENNLDLIKDLL